jgi:tetratricopeptide (TPR) repeat protein
MEKILELDSTDVRIHNEKCNLLIELKRYDNETIKYCDETIRVNPQYAPSWHKKGIVLLEMKQVKESLECFNKAIHIDATNKEFWEDKGRALIGLRKFDEAIEWFDKILNIEPTDLNALHKKGICLCAIGIECYNEKNFKKALNCLMFASIILEQVNAPENDIAREYIVKIKGDNAVDKVK